MSRWWWWALVGCGSSGTVATDDAPSDTVADTDTDTDTDSDTDADADTDSDTDTDTETLPATFTDFGAAGAAAVTEREGSLALAGCDLDYVEFLPDGRDDGPLLVLGHGFQRNARNMGDLARHVASHGVRVVTPDYCFSGLLNADPPRNGADAAALAAALSGGAPTMHAGHSNGGLSAHFAAAADSLAVAVLGLDPVDTDGVVDDALDGLTVPLWSVIGEPTSCNDDARILADLQGAGAAISAIPGANHCDFESPTDGLCTTFCGDHTGLTPLVQALLAAFAAHYAGTDPTAVEWLPGGARYEELVGVGVLITL
jgi:hypothetical protein